MTEDRQEIDREMTESKVTLAGYLAVHHHQNNLAMMFANPSVKVRLLLSYVLMSLRQEANVLVECSFLRSVIAQCHLKVKEVGQQYEQGNLSDDEAEKMINLYLKKATLAHDKLMELSNATN